MTDHSDGPDRPGRPNYPDGPDCRNAAERAAVADLLEPLEKISSDPLPPRFGDALIEVRAAIARCHTAGIPEDTTLAALLVETMPRLVEAYGAEGAAAMLGQLTQEISEAGRPPASLQ